MHTDLIPVLGMYVLLHVKAVILQNFHMHER